MKMVYMILCLGALGLISCSDWLDVQPKTSIDEDKLFEKEAGFKDALTGFYLKMGTPSLYARELSYNYLDLLAQLYDNGPEIRYDKGTVYNYEGVTYKSLKNSLFSDMFNIIANINNFLYYLDERKEVVVTPDYYEVMKGEALGLRAFLHFDLLRLFGPVYRVSPSEVAIPYRLRFDNVATPVLPAREVVELILADLHQADSLLQGHDTELFDPNSSGNNEQAFLGRRQMRMNVYAVKAMLARVYCYKGDEESKRKACEYAREVIECGHFELAESNVQNRILFQEHIFSLYVYELYKIVDEDFVNNSFSDIMSITSETLDEIYEVKDGGGSTDFRGNNYAFNALTDKSVQDAPKIVLTKYDQSVYSGGYNGLNLIPLIRLPEMYYILAECDPSGDESAEYLNKVRFARGIPGSDALSGVDFDKPDSRQGYDKEQTMRTNEVMREIRKEYYGEGQLFYFYKKYNYKTFYHCPLQNIREKYQLPLPENEIIFGTTK